LNEIDAEGQRVNWEKFFDLPRDIDITKLGRTAEEGAEFGELPGAAMKSQTYNSIEKDFVDWVYSNHYLEVHSSPLLEAFSNPGESAGDFRVRIAQTARELRDKMIETLREKYGKKIKDLETKAAKAMDKLETQKAQASSAKLQTAVSIGTSILGALFGRKSGIGAASSVVRSSSVSSVSRAWKESREAGAAEGDLERIKVEMGEIEKQVGDETQKIRDQYEPATLVLETVKLTPVKKNIQPTATGILWLPHERVGEKDLRQAW
jgi:hypothetical protein